MVVDIDVKMGDIPSGQPRTKRTDKDDVNMTKMTTIDDRHFVTT